MAVTSPPGLARNKHAANYLTLLGADSVRADTAAFAGAAVWALDSFPAGELAPGAISRPRNIQIAVKTGVHSFIATFWTDATPAAAPVSALPPDQLPHFAEGGVLAGDSAFGDSIQRGVVLVQFLEQTPQPLRQAAVDAIHGRVIGGAPILDGDGFYIVAVPDDGTPASVRAALDVLDTLPQVEVATPLQVNRAIASYLKPFDGPGDFRSWQIDPAKATGLNWGLERARAPLAWGCSTGSAATSVAVVDQGIDTVTQSAQPSVITDLSRNTLFLSANDSNAFTHGRAVASVLGAFGNDSVGMSGMMWRAGLVLVDRFSDPAHPGQQAPQFIDGRLADPSFLLERHLVNAALRGASIINVSLNTNWDVRLLGRRPSRSNSDDVRRANEDRKLLAAAIRRAAARGFSPLFVVSAGNWNLDAFWGGFNLAEQDFPDQVITVGASDIMNARWVVDANNGSNSGDLVDVYAPGAGVGADDGRAGSATITSETGTSFAAPMVAGIAGLAKSLDPSLSSGQLKGLIIDAARHHGVAVADGKFLVDAYETLKAVASRVGGPICGNRIFIDPSAHLIIERRKFDDTFVDDPIAVGDFSSGDPLNAAIVNVLHNGHFIDVFDGVQAWGLEFRNGEWIRNSYDADASASRFPSASTGLLGPVSHNGDTTFFAIQVATGPHPSFQLRIIDSTGVVHDLGAPMAGVVTGAVYPMNGPEIFAAVAPNSDAGQPEAIIGVNVQTAVQRTIFTRAPGSLGTFLRSTEAGDEFIVSYTGPFPDFTTCFVEYRSVATGALIRQLQVPQQLGCADRSARQVESASKRPTRPAIVPSRPRPRARGRLPHP